MHLAMLVQLLQEVTVIFIVVYLVRMRQKANQCLHLRPLLKVLGPVMGREWQDPDFCVSVVNHDAPDIWGSSTSLWWYDLCTTACLQGFLGSTHQMPVVPPPPRHSCDTQYCLHTSRNKNTPCPWWEPLHSMYCDLLVRKISLGKQHSKTGRRTHLGLLSYQVAWECLRLSLSLENPLCLQ